jgi:hypothetical protein
MIAPLTKAPHADAFGRALLMSLASVNFLAAVIIWLHMPETLAEKSSQSYQLTHTTTSKLCYEFCSAPLNACIYLIT